MKSILKNRKLNIYQAFLSFIILSIYLYGIYKICGFTLFPDEFGYWASAAKNIGYDWSEVASMGSYYSFGYSLILTPILKLFADGVMAYRAAVAVNCLLMCVAAFLLCRIVNRIFPENTDLEQAFSAGIGILYPAWIFYMQMTLTESLLMFLFILSVYFLILLLQKKSIVTALLLAVTIIYLYCVHMRTVGVLISVIVVLFLWAWMEPGGRKPVLAFAIALIAFGLIAWGLKQETIATVFAYANEEMLKINDYGNQWSKFREFFSLHEIWQLFKEILAKIYYLGMASFGIFYWSIGWSLHKIFRHFFRKKKDVNSYIAIFLFLSSAAEIVISAIYMYRGENIDTLVYGRYSEFVLPVLMGIGICVMLKSPYLCRATLLLGTFSGFLTLMILNVIENEKREGMRGYMAVGISYLLENTKNIYLYFQRTWILCFIMMLAVAIVLAIVRRRKSLTFLMAGILALEIFLGLWASHNYTYQYNAANFMDLTIADTIAEQMKEGDRVVYLDEEAPEFIDFIQMQLRDSSIEVMKTEEFEKLNWKTEKPQFMITYVNTEWKEEIEKQFDKCVKSNTFLLFYDTREK